ncbi:MAG TPA: gamma-glutamyl-phosphate reductase, partial [Actinomycetota bacterium]|nr:gamma-glutamyl-phosphate reductase [Actinomycetota bacterium]
MSAPEPLAGPARDAAAALATATTEAKNRALAAMAEEFEARAGDILEPNAADVSAAEAEGAPPAVIDRLGLDEARVRQMADGLRDVAALDDPIGDVLDDRTLENGLRIRKVRVPLGVIGV